MLAVAIQQQVHLRLIRLAAQDHPHVEPVKPATTVRIVLEAVHVVFVVVAKRILLRIG